MRHTGIAGKIFIAAVLLFIYIPIVIIVVYSFNGTNSLTQFNGFSFEWYKALFTVKTFGKELKNSAFVSIMAVIVSAVLGTLGAAGAAARKFRGEGAFETVSILPIMIPEIIMGISFLTLFSFAGIKAGLFRVILAHAGFCVPYVYLIVKARLAGLDTSALEAARDLGAGKLRAFFTVTLPAIAPAVMSGALISFAMSFDDVVISMMLQTSGDRMLPSTIFSLVKTRKLTPEVNALFSMMLFTALMFILLFFIGRKAIKYNLKKRV